MSVHPPNDISVLATQVQFLKGVGPERAPLLERMGLKTAQDILFFFPREYKEIVDIVEVHQLQEKQQATIVGTVLEIEERTTANNTHILGVLLRQGGNYLRGTWFNQPFMRHKFFEGQRVAFTGEAKMSGLRWQMNHPRIQILETKDDHFEAEILPVYRLTNKLTQRAMRRIARNAIETCVAHVPEVLPADFLQTKGLPGIQLALREIHNPTTIESRNQAIRRFVFQELFMMQLALAMRKGATCELQTGIALNWSAQIDARIRKLFPFELTIDQERAIKDVKNDMQRTTPMHRLLQGDVGTGKTIVAAYAILLAVANQKQAVLMAPTEILAEQHSNTLARLLQNSRVTIEQLTGATKKQERDRIREQSANREIDVLVSTQAVLSNAIPFADLGLIIIDEQHKFGVRQRANLKTDAVDPHYLVMTATPIPRTMTMTLFGDLDVSFLRELPANRTAVKTYWATNDQRSKWWAFFRKKLREGRQGFVIAPLVDQDADELQGAEQLMENLCNGELADFRIDILHGRMTSDEKRIVMDDFRSGKAHVLVATSAVEVGIDVPNASLMTIENAHRFGLAQLHQLRGRVGRGQHPGFVCAFADVNNESSKQRLDAFVKYDNGFDLAEVDFELRGPGEVFGTKQHGLPPLMMADLRRDTAIVAEARNDARELIAKSPNLDAEEWQLFKRRVIAKYGRQLDLGGVG